MKKKLLHLLPIFFLQGHFLFSFGQTVVINEVLTSPFGNSLTNSNSMYNDAPGEQPPDNQEWIELYNPNPCNSVDISCYTIGGNMLQISPDGTAMPNWGAFTFPSGTVIPPGGFIIIGGNNSVVPILEFNTTTYRQTSYGIQYIDGDPTRWFLRDEYGWVAIYNPNGNVVDAVYWDAAGNPANLFGVTEYQQNIITRTSCSGTQTLAAARNIAGIEYMGACSPGTYLSFQRTRDGANTWHTSPITPTPHACNGPCVTPPQLSFIVHNENCGSANGSISMTIIDGYTGPYTINWLNPPGLHTNNITHLTAGTYMVQVVDAYNCYIVYDTITLINTSGPQIQIDSIRNEMCSALNGAIYTHVVGGTAPLSFLWNSAPPQQTQNLNGVHGGNYSVTITDAGGCIATADTILNNTPPPTLVFDQIQSDTCNKRIGAIHVLASGGNPPYSYNWSTDSADILDHISHLSEGDYTVSVTDDFCVASASAHIDNYPGPKADFQFQPPVAIIEDPTFNFEDISSGIIDRWSWYFGDMMSSSDRNPVHTYRTVGAFDVMLKISNDNGCVDSITKRAIVVDKPSLFIPNCFTPNGDGVNDYFFAAGVNISDFTIFIFNRWGELVFTSHSIDDHWDGRYKGKIVPEGIYNWTISYNENYGGVMVIPKNKKGLLTVII